MRADSLFKYLSSINTSEEIAVRVEFPLVNAEITTWATVFDVSEWGEPVIVISIPEVTAL